MNTKTPQIIIKSNKTLTLKKNTAIAAEPNSESLTPNRTPFVPAKLVGEKKIQKYTAAKVHDFSAIYKELHSKFPAIINLNKPVLLTVGVRKAMREVTGISGVVLKKWIAWYCHNSKYYDLHKVGATRFNLDGTKAGIVTEKHQEYRNKDLVQTKKLQIKEVDKSIMVPKN